MGLKHLSTLKSSKSSRLDFCAAHCLAILSGVCSSQSKFWRHKIGIILLPSSLNGAASPSGSYIELNDDHIPCLVKGSLSCLLEILVCHLQCSKGHAVFFHYQKLFLATPYLELRVTCLFVWLAVAVPYYYLQIWLI